jgi:hypothetical protein
MITLVVSAGAVWPMRNIHTNINACHTHGARNDPSIGCCFRECDRLSPRYTFLSAAAARLTVSQHTHEEKLRLSCVDAVGWAPPISLLNNKSLPSSSLLFRYTCVIVIDSTVFRRYRAFGRISKDQNSHQQSSFDQVGRYNDAGRCKHKRRTNNGAHFDSTEFKQQWS